MKGKAIWWIIAIAVIVILGLIGSCDGSKDSDSGKLVSGVCSHCHGRGMTSYGNECAWCNGTGFWAYYD